MTATRPTLALIAVVALSLAACDEEPSSSAPTTAEDATNSGGNNNNSGDVGDDAPDVAEDVAEGDVAPDVAPEPRVLGERAPGSFDARYPDMATCMTAGLEDTFATGAVAGVLEDGELVYSVGVGNKGVGIEEPVESSTLFRFGSVLKMMTAAGLLSVADDGHLDMNATIDTVVPELAFDDPLGASLTPHLLLSHQGGMRDELDFNGPTDDEGLREFLTSADFLDIAFYAPPGTFYNYSNPNFYLAGLMIEAADPSGSSYRAQMQARVFGPLGMTRTMFRPEDVLADGDYASGTSVTALFGERANAPDAYENAWARPAGLGWTSIEDLLRFGRFLMEGDPAVLTPESWQALRSHQVLTLSMGELESYGYGVIVQKMVARGAGDYRDATILLHDGSTADFTSLLLTVPETGFAFAVMANGPTGPMTGCLVEALVDELERFPEGELPAEVLPDPATFADFVGSYDEDLGNITDFSLALSPDGQELQINVPAIDELPNITYEPILTPLSRDNFLFETNTGNIPMTGVRDENGDVAYVRTRIGVGVRKDGSEKHLGVAARDLERARGLKPALEAAARPALISPILR